MDNERSVCSGLEDRIGIGIPLDVNLAGVGGGHFLFKTGMMESSQHMQKSSSTLGVGLLGYGRYRSMQQLVFIECTVLL